MAKRLEGRAAVVTGAGRGIGRAIAELLAIEGAAVVVNDLGGAVDGTGASRGAAAETIVGTAVKEFGAIDILVNNAGILRDRMIFNMTEEDWDAVIAVHLKGTFNMCRHACEYWREEHKKGDLLNGRIVNTSSDAGLLGNVGQSNYGACKAAVAAMAIIIGQEMKKYGVTANAIAPVARTRLTVDATPSTAALMGAEAKPGEFDMFSPANVAPLVAWLASDDAASVNGQVFRVGGRSVWPMKGWHSATRIKNPEPAPWEPMKLGARIKEELAKGITAPEGMGDVFAGGL